MMTISRAEADALKDPEFVYVNMLRGLIARPTMRQLVALHGEVPNGEDAQLARIAELQAQLASTPALREVTDEDVDAVFKAAYPDHYDVDRLNSLRRDNVIATINAYRGRLMQSSPAQAGSTQAIRCQSCFGHGILPDVFGNLSACMTCNGSGKESP